MKSPYSQEYIEERKKELYRLLAQAKTEQEKEMLIKAFQISIKPTRKGGFRR